MTYENLINSVTEIINNELIIKEGLTLNYVLPEKKYRKLHEEFFYRVNKLDTPIKKIDVFEVFVSGVLITIKKENENV